MTKTQKIAVWKITIIRSIPPLPPPSPPASNLSTNNDRKGGDTPSAGRDISSTKSEISPPKKTRNDAHFEKGEDIGGSGDGGDAFPMYLPKIY